MDQKLLALVKALIRYSMHDIEYEYEQLTSAERQIIGTPENLALLKAWAESNA